MPAISVWTSQQDHQEQWQKLLDTADEIRAFLKEHDAALKSKS